MIKVEEHADSLIAALKRAFAAAISNSAGPTPPSNPLPGQLWADTSEGKIKAFFDGQWSELQLNGGTGSTGTGGGNNIVLPDGVDLNVVITGFGSYTLGSNVINGPYDGSVDNGQLIVSASDDSLLQIVSDIYGAAWFRVANKIEMPGYLDFKPWQRMGTFRFKGFKDDYTHDYFAGDLDSIDKNSIYSFGAQEVFNGPPGLDVNNNERCFVHTMIHNQFSLTSTQFVYAQGKAFMRHNANGQWSEWEQLRVVRKPLVTDDTMIQLTSNLTNLIFNSDTTQTFVSITLPSDDGLTDGHEVTIMTKSDISSLSINGNGKPVYGAPTTLPAGGFATFIYSSDANAWFRKG